jgi:hypothetical protein
MIPRHFQVVDILDLPLVLDVAQGDFASVGGAQAIADLEEAGG